MVTKIYVQRRAKLASKEPENVPREFFCGLAKFQSLNTIYNLITHSGFVAMDSFQGFSRSSTFW